jgi:hypothetical protein
MIETSNGALTERRPKVMLILPSESPLSPARFYIFERLARMRPTGGYEWVWSRYKDYTDPVKLPPWLNSPAPGYITPLANNASEYD